MNLDDKHQRVPIPKWRALSSTPSSELVSAGKMQPNAELAIARADRMHALYERWQETPSIDNALELLDCSSFIDDKGLFYGPAAQIINSDRVTQTSKFVAQQVIRPGRAALTRTFDFKNKEHIHRAISENRIRLRDQARNALLHAEQARLYAIVDEASAAERSFTSALALAPNNRHVLRSYARFMVHVGTPKPALERLRKSAAIASDPWIQAAEVSVANHSQTGSSVAKLATRHLDASQVRAEHMSELAAALATLERHSGHRKRFKKRFAESLNYPSENALAQASWFFREAADDLPEEFAGVLLPAVSSSAEARTYAFLKTRKWSEAVKSFAQWQSEESFSSHIAIQGSFYAISLAKDFESAISICRNGLIANSASHCLLNNLCYAERRGGFVDDAVKTMRLLKTIYPDWHTSPYYLATDGMLNFAKGSHDAGRDLYLAALKEAEKEDDGQLCQRVKMHWFHEEALSGAVTKEQAHRLFVAIEGELGDADKTSETFEYWQNMKNEIAASCEKSGEVHSAQRSVPHVIEQHF